jgi:hypothetical protein
MVHDSDSAKSPPIVDSIRRFAKKQENKEYISMVNEHPGCAISPRWQVQEEDAVLSLSHTFLINNTR